uniref:Transport and Golgi organization protein 1-like n=2 Tax=Hirondellea gigas TaxID=1518452 RepID=A0A2P2HWN2_9CRUS
MQLNSGRNYSSMVDAAEAARVTALLVKAQDENADLVERVQELEQEVEESTSSGLEMHAMLQDLLHSQKDTASFQEAIDNLQTMLDSQREKVESLTADLTVKTAMNDELKVEHVASRERVKTLEYQLEQVTHSLEEVNSSKVQACAELTAEQLRGQSATKQQQSLAQSYAQATATLQELQLKYDAAQTKAEKLDKKLRTREAELQVSKECLKQLKVFNDGKASKDKLRQLLDVVTVKSELSSVETERSRLQVELEKRCAELQAMQDAVQQSQQLADSCSRVQAQAEEEKSDAVSKLVVLTNYFQEKEAQLTKELESESGLRQTAESSADNVSSRIKHYEMQLLSSRTQVDGMKKELEDQEQSYRAQLAAQEQKAHESWVAARAAERKYEEAKQETGQLRSRLLLMSKESNQQNAVLKPTAKHPETTNGSLHSPRPPLDELDAEHHSLNQLDSPHNIPPPFMLPHMFPPHGAPPLPPNALPPFPPGMPPLPGMHPPPPPFLPHPHPHHHMPPAIMSDRRMPPAGRLASPPFHRRGGSSSPPFIEPPYDGRRSPNHYDRRSYSPGSEHSARYSDRPRHYSPPHRHYDRYNDRYSSPERRGADSSPDRWYNRSPDGYANKTSPVPSNSTRRDYDQVAPKHKTGKKTSTPLGPSDR